MNKSIEAFLRGYMDFKVNGKKFNTYNAANDYVKLLPLDADVSFIGWHVFKGYRSFYIRVVNPKFESASHD